MPHHDLVVLGAGSGNTVIDGSFADRDVAIIEHGAFGGTCLNVGCIPTKMFAYTAYTAYTADTAEQVRGAGTYGLDADLRGVRWDDIRDRVFDRLNRVASSGRDHRLRDPNVTTYLGDARFTGPRALRVERADGSGHDDVTADRIVLAAGARPLVPEPVEASGVPFETSDTIMHLPGPPARLAVLGGGYIAAEFAHIFAELGSAVTLIEMTDQLLGGQDETVAEAFTDLARRRYDVRLGREVVGVDGEGDEVWITLDDGAVVVTDLLLVAVGRIPNGDRLDLAKAGVDVHDDGRVVVDGRQYTSADGVLALGDISSPVQLKHVANRQARVVAHNLLHPDDPWETDLDAVPAAIFTSPGIASVGRTEQSCRDDGLDYAASVRPYSDTAYGWAMEDRTGFCKVLAERGTGRLLGAHLLGPQAATLIQPLVVALSCGIDARTLARRPYWIHPALTEVVENAVLDLGPVNNPCGAAGSNVCSTHDEFADRRPGRPRREGPRRVDHR